MSSPTKSQAIVLHLIRQGDSSAVVQVIDSMAGRQSLFVRRLGGRSGKAAAGLSPATFHNLAILDTVTVASPKSSLLYLREAEPMFSLNGIRSDISKSTTAMFISEVLYRTLRTDDGDTDLFKWLVETTVRFDAVEGSVANYHLWWLTAYCIKAGFRPDDNWSPETPVFDIVSARFVAPFHSGEGGVFHDDNQLFSQEDSLLLHRMINSTMEEALSIPLNASRRVAFSRRMLRYLSCHFSCDLDIKSLDVLHAVFA